MRITIKNKGLIVLMFIVGMCTLIGGNIIFMNIGTNIAGALEADNTVLTVQKVLRDVDQNDNDITNGYSYLASTEVGNYTHLNSIANDAFEMLNNNAADESLIAGTAVENVKVENILIKFADSYGNGLPWLTASAWLNGTPIDVGSAMIIETNGDKKIHSLT